MSNESMTDNINSNTGDDLRGKNIPDNPGVATSSGQNGKELHNEDTPPKEKKGSKRSKSKRRSRSHSRKSKGHESSSSSAYSEDDSSSSSSESSDEPQPKRFKIVLEEDKNKYTLPKSMAKYVNEHLECTFRIKN